jgi:hypothetical protein
MKYLIVVKNLKNTAHKSYIITLKVYNSPTIKSTIFYGTVATILSSVWFMLASAANVGIVSIPIPGQSFYVDNFVGYYVPDYLNGIFQSLKIFFKLTKSQIINRLCVMHNGSMVVDGHLLLIFVISSGHDFCLGLVVNSPFYINTLLVLNNLSFNSFITLIGLNSSIDYSFSTEVFNLQGTVLTLPRPTIIPFNWQPLILQPNFEYGLMNQLDSVIIDPEINYVELMRDAVGVINENNNSNHSGSPSENNFK